MSGESPGIIAATGLNNSKLEVLDETLEDPGQVHLRSSRPLTSHKLLRKANESRTTSRLESDTSNTRTCDRLATRRRERSDDERRLLGDYDKDPDAVPITRPHNPPWQERMTPGILQGGPRPINTLGSMGSSLKKIGHGIKGAASYGINSLKRGHLGSYPSSLDIVTSSGDNVVNSVKAFDLLGDWDQGPPRKKSRTTANPSIQSDFRYLTRMADDHESSEVDEGKVGRFPPLPPKTNYNSSVLSQGSEIISNSQSLRGRTARVGNQEYRATEEMMTPRSKSRRRSRNSQPVTATSGAVPHVTIDLSTDDQVVANHKQPYRGTARETKSRINPPSERHRNALHEYKTETKSRHFQNAKKLKISSSMRGANARPTDEQAEQPDLRSRFVDDKGNRRDSLMGDSPDELQNGTTIGSHSHEVQHSRAHMSLGSRKPSEDICIRPVTPPRQVQGLPESNIRRTEFTSSGRRPRKMNSNEGVPRAPKPTPEWGVDLAKFRTGRANLNGRSGCGLVYDKSKEQFVAKYEGHDLAEDIPELSINPRRVTRILVGDGDSCKLRLYLSQSVDSDCCTDIELGTHKDVVDLVVKLQHLSPGIAVKMSDKMDRIFERRLSEVGPQLSLNNKPQTDMGDDIQLLQIKERRKKAGRGTGDLRPAVYGKQTPRDANVDAVDELGEIRVLGDHRGSLRPSNPSQLTATAGRNRESGLGTHQRQSSNHHQTRSQMQQSASNDPIQTPSLEPPREDRYSKVHGLGTPWTKPLVFPQAGKRKATVEWKDLQRLDEGEFLNDNLMGFYLRHLEYGLEQKHPELAQKIYFFNTYFFASLTNTPRGKRGINYEAVQKWTRTVDIFAFDYVVVPINESAHWYVAIICNLPALDRKLEAEDETNLQPAINVSSDKTPSLSSRAPSSSVADEMENKAALSDIDADGTRHSFAEMNLEGKHEPYNHDVAEESMLDAELSHRPNERSPKEEHSLEQAIQLDQEIAEVLPSAVELSKVNVPSSGKKGRRKSTTRLQKYEPGSPIIITLDSLGLSHSPTVRILKDYLAQEGKAKRALEYPDDAIKGMTAKGIPLQNNFCDCGLYLLGYLDRLVQDPQGLCHKILQRELDADVDWPSLNPSHMRDQLRTKIQELHMEQEAERKEIAKKTGNYIHKGHTKPTTSSKTMKLSPSGPPTKVNETSRRSSKANRESALESVVATDQEPQSKVRTIQQSPKVKPSPEHMESNEKEAQSAMPTAASQEDAPVFLGEKPVKREALGSRDLKIPLGGPKGEREDASEYPTAPSPRKFLQKVEILSRNPTVGDSDMLGV